MKKWILALAALLLAASALPAFAQVVLTGSFGQSAEMLSYEEEGDGAYTQTLLTDSGALIATGRAAPRPGLNDTLEAALNERYGDAGNVQTLEMPPVAGYPAQRVRLRHGEGAEAQIVDYIYIPTDEWIFFAEIRVPADAEAELDELREIWVGSIDLFDDGLPAPDANAEADAADEIVEAAAPLSWEELATYVILTDEGDTVSDLVEMFAPESYVWHADARPRLELVCADGTLTLLPNAYPADADGPASELSEAVLAGGCDFAEARWLGEGFPLYPLRGLYPGVSMEAVVTAYDGGDRERLDDVENADERVVYSITAEPPQQGRAALSYYGLDGEVACVQLSWYPAE